MFYSSINNHVKRDNIIIVLKCNFLRVVRSIKLIDELIVCLTIESQRCGSQRFDRYTAGLHQAMVSTDCVTV